MQNATTWMPVKHIADITDTNDMVLMLYPYERYWGYKTQILNFTGRSLRVVNMDYSDIYQAYLFTFRNHKDYSAQDLKIFKHCLN